MSEGTRTVIMLYVLCCFAGKFVDGCGAVRGSVLSCWVGSWLDTGTLWPTTELIAIQTARPPGTDLQDRLQLPAKTCQKQTVRAGSQLYECGVESHFKMCSITFLSLTDLQRTKSLQICAN